MKKFVLVLLVLFFNDISYAYQKSFREEYFSHKGYASDKWDNYLDIYDMYLRAYINKKAKVLEVGVQNGGFLQVLDKYLGNAQIYGLDITPEICNHSFGKSIKMLCFDATSENALKSSAIDSTVFDVVIDDSSHHNKDVINTFKLFFPKLTPGGVYIIEDVHTAYWKEYGGRYLGEGTSIEHFKKYLDYLNRFHIKEGDSYVGMQKNVFTFDSKEVSIANWIESISFYDSVIIIKKGHKERTEPHKRISTGELDPIAKLAHLKKYNQ